MPMLNAGLAWSPIETSAILTCEQRAASVIDADAVNDAFQRALDALIRFGNEQGKTDEEDLRWPSREAIAVALKVLRLASRYATVFDRVIPDGEGGISLERRTAAQLERIVISENGQLECQRFRHSKLTDSWMAHLPVE